MSFTVLVWAFIAFTLVCGGVVSYALYCKGDISAGIKTRIGEFSLEAKEQRKRQPEGPG